MTDSNKPLVAVVDPLCARCGYRRSDHAMIKDGTFFIEEYRHCMLEGIDCPTYAATDKERETQDHLLEQSIVRKDLHEASLNSLILQREGEQYFEDKEENNEDDDDIGVEYIGPMNSDNDLYIDGPICNHCVGSKYPGILWPVEEDLHIERCDECKLFVDDETAAFFLSAVMGIPIMKDARTGKWFSPIPEPLVRSLSRAVRVVPDRTPRIRTRG